MKLKKYREKENKKIKETIGTIGMSKDMYLSWRCRVVNKGRFDGK